MKKKHTLTDLLMRKTLRSSQFDDLKIDTDKERVWLSRMTVEDGMPCNNMITEEELIKGRWVITKEYCGK